MQRILILGGGVGGTLTANLLVQEAAPPGQGGRGDDHRRRPDGPPRLPAGVHVHRDGRRARRPPRSARSVACSTRASTLVVGEVERVDDAAQIVQLADGQRLGYDYLVLATGSPDRARGDRALRDRGPSLLHAPRRRSSSAGRSTRSTAGGSSIGIAGMPYKCPPAPLEVAFLIEAELRERGLREQERAALLLADRARVHDRERLGDGDPDPRRAGASSCTRSSTSRRSTPSARSSRASRARSSRTTC